MTGRHIHWRPRRMASVKIDMENRKIILNDADGERSVDIEDNQKTIEIEVDPQREIEVNFDFRDGFLTAIAVYGGWWTAKLLHKGIIEIINYF